MTTYSELMVAAHKAETETEEAKDKIRAKSAVITESVDGSIELSNQIARLIAALTRDEQGNCPASAPNSPRHQGHERGQMDRNTLNHPSCHNGWTGLGQIASAHGATVACGQNVTFTGAPDSKAEGSTRGTTSKKESSSLQCFRCQGWGHMAQECATPSKSLNLAGGTEGMWPTPHWQQPTVGTQHSLPDPKPQLTFLKGTQRKEWSKATPAQFLNHDPIAQLVGCSNEASMIVDGQETTALIDLDAQVSSVSAKFCEDLTLQIQLLEFEGTGGAAIPYLRFMRLTSRSCGLGTTTRMCCWLYKPQPILRQFWTWMVPK